MPVYIICRFLYHNHNPLLPLMTLRSSIYHPAHYKIKHKKKSVDTSQSHTKLNTYHKPVLWTKIKTLCD